MPISNRKHLITKLAPVKFDRDADASVWHGFLDRLVTPMTHPRPAAGERLVE